MLWIPFYRCKVCRSLGVNYATAQLSQGWTTESHDLCFAVIPRHKLLELTFSEFHISSFSIINGPWRWEIICKYCNSKQTGGSLLDEHGVLSRELLGINVIVGLCFRTVSEGTFLPLRIFNSAMPRCFCHDYFYEHNQSKILEWGMCCARRENETLLYKRNLLSIQDWLSKCWSQCEHQLILMGPKTGKNYWTLSNLATSHALTFARKKIRRPAQWDHCSREATQTSRVGLILVQINLIKLHREIRKYPN